MDSIENSVSFTKDEPFESVQTWAESTQQRCGDRLSQGHMSVLPTELHVDLSQNNGVELVSFWRQLNEETQNRFRQKFGDVADLLFVPVEEPLVRAVMRFWDPLYRCFSFNRHDLVPTLEEYTLMLGICNDKPYKIYSRKLKLATKRKLSKLLGVEVGLLEPYWREKGDCLCFTWDFLKGYLASHLQEEVGLRALALAIYGLVIFPRVLGHIEEMVVDLIDMIQYGYNPVTAVLAETIRSLNFCRQHPGKRFIGCLPFLYVWIKSHFKCEEKHFAKSFQKGKPVQEFCKSLWPKPESEKWWVCYLSNLKSDEIEWFAPWMRHVSTLYRCGNEFEVPLLGLWGMVSYCPLQALRQYGIKQLTPVTHKLGQNDAQYTQFEDLTRINRWVMAWKQTYRVKVGNLLNMITPAYGIWRAQKVEDKVSPPEIMMCPPEEPRPIMLSALEIAQAEFATEVEKLRQENTRLHENNEKLRLEARDRKFELCQAMKDADTANAKLKELEEENKKLWLDNQGLKKRRALNVRDQMQEQIEHWKNQASTHHGRAVYWQEQHSALTQRLAECEEKLRQRQARESFESLQRRIRVLEAQMNKQNARCEHLLITWRKHDAEQERQLKEARQLEEAWRAEAGDRQHIINSMMGQVRMVANEAERMAEETEQLMRSFYPKNEMDLNVWNFLYKAKRQYNEVVYLYRNV